MFIIIVELFSTNDLTHVLEQMSQISNYAFVSMVPAHSSFLSCDNAMQEISGDDELPD